MSNAASRMIDIPYVYADILDSSGASLGRFGVAHLTTTFSVGNLPTCSVQINDGTDMSSPVSEGSKVLELLDRQGTDDLHIKIVMNMVVSAEDVDTKSKPDAREEIVFNGIVTGMTIVYKYMTSTRSAYGVNVTAIHRFADLYAFGAGGLIYAPAKLVDNNQSISDVMSKLSSKSRHENGTSSVYDVSIVGEVLSECVPTLEGSSSSKPYKSIPETISIMINRMRDNKVLVPEGKDPKIDTYIKGTIKPAVKSKTVNEFYDSMLKLLFHSVAQGNLADAIQASCTSNMGIYLVPRSTDSMYILPMSCASVAPKEVPIISADRYRALKYNPNMRVGANIQGVLVTYAGSDLMPNSGWSDALIRGRFPEHDNKGAVRWKCVPAPKWFYDKDIYGNTAENSKQARSSDYIQDLCTLYAADQYFTHKYRNNTVEVTCDLRALHAYSALGATFDIEYPTQVRKGDNPPKIRATLTSYTLAYRSSVEGSGVEVVLEFNNARSSTVASVEPKDKSLYSIDDTDLVKAFPDISVEFKEKKS